MVTKSVWLGNKIAMSHGKSSSFMQKLFLKD